ncbi:hypothetical protein ANOM_004698 [Aspergillus nomiae NRRL 13137]|uniref:Pheromone-regulated membrane protein n=1 Tax=Aspergillus nomiae NRRL (strain ATCC 15546 / NRRL 13137 / CBS 260.88 / M93) TaxID=1509407 RepID=A0A0L1J5L2_ASPN3|nr:uncharacterized protein ANOM_004698 [Aspergillus nomiae NRRL 13137]KNG87024.1 hypothetical protein ANOM_004698 [Aspergillus nomiae NRRL 13137]
MPCCGDREKGPVSLEEQWDYINLNDFKSESCLSPFSYFFLWVFLVISIAVYAVDTFTAVNLLAFSKWAGQIEPAIPFTVSRWIFAVCIIISFVLLVLRWIRAIRAIRSGSISQSYLDSLAARIQSIRLWASGHGWKRFLVFAELTKSRKGAEYVALFAYFSFETWMNVLLADGPRQVVNAITLYSVMRMDLLPGGENAPDTNDSSPVIQFFDNVKILAENNNLRALVLFGMLFTLIIWVLSILKLALAIILYLIFLFHHIPSQDGSLKAYCRRKIKTRLTRIVRRKVNKALAKGMALQERTPTQPNMGLDTHPTLPTVGGNDKAPIVTTLSRSTTQTTLPSHPSRPEKAAPDRAPTLPSVAAFEDKPPLSRTMTQSSAYSASTSLSGSTAVSGYSPLDRQSSPAPPVPPLPTQVPTPASRIQTPMSRFNSTPQPAPAASDGGVNGMAPAHAFGDTGDIHSPYKTYPSHDLASPAPYHSYSPTDTTARTLTPGRSMSPEENGPIRTFSPPGPSGTPTLPSLAGYPTRSFGAAGQPPARPQPNFSMDEETMRNFSHAAPRGAPRPPGPDGYAPFNPPSRNSPAPFAREFASNSPVYQQSGPRTFAPLAEYDNRSAPARTYSNRAYPPQPQNYGQGYM